jgi:4-aminobutyrate aminotransferase-like enzyme
MLRLQERYEFIGKVSGRGLLIGVELVQDRQSKAPLDKEKCRGIFLQTLRRGMLAMNYKANFRINPPLSLNREEADQALAILDDVFAHVEKQYF